MIAQTPKKPPADRRADPPAGGIRRRGWSAAAAPAAGPGVIAAVGLVLFLVSLRRADLGRMTGLGLISVLPVASLAGVGLLVVAFVLMLGLSRPRPVALGAMLAAVVLCLDGAAAIAEPEPRFATAYQIAGFADYISRTGHTAPNIDAYFSWPGFFALTAFLEGIVGQHDLIPVLRWWPVLIDLLCLVPLGLIMRNLRITWRAKWFAALLFSLGNWVGQDYFSPQSFNYLLYLLFIAILLTWFGSSAAAGPTQEPRAEEPRAGRLRRIRWRAFGRLSPGELPARQASASERVLLLLLLIAIFAISTVSHQLTPFLMLAACTALVVARRCSLTGLPVLLGVILIGWVSFETVAYWSGHLTGIFGGVGHVGANVSASVGGRLTGSTPEHQLVLFGRVAFAAVVMALAVLGLLRRRHALVSDRALVVLMCVPFLSVGLQNYGGEIALRIYLFALPAASVLAACLFFPAVRPGRRSWRALAAAAVLGAAFAGLFFAARYGNEAFEQTPAGELAAVNYVYSHDKGGASVAWLSETPTVNVTPEMPWEYHDIGIVRYVPVQAPVNPQSVAGLVAELRHLGPGSYLITTATQDAYLQQAASYPPGWGGRLRASLAAAPGVRVVFANRSAAIYTVRWPPGTPGQRLSVSTGAGARTTLWTPVGLIIWGELMAVLVARELLRVSRPGSRSLVRLLTLASAPLLAMLLVVVIERFVVLS